MNMHMCLLPLITPVTFYYYPGLNQLIGTDRYQALLFKFNNNKC